MTAAFSADPERNGRGIDGGVAEEGLDLGGVGSALAEARAEGVAAAVGARAWDARRRRRRSRRDLPGAGAARAAPFLP